MTERTVTFTLPEALFQRAQETADASSLSIEAVFTLSIGRLLPTLEDDLSPSQRADLAVIALKSDEELRSIASAFVDMERQARLEELAMLQKTRPLTSDEQTELDRLLDFSYQFMLCKAEAMRLLALRGYKVFPGSEPEII